MTLHLHYTSGGDAGLVRTIKFSSAPSRYVEPVFDGARRGARVFKRGDVVDRSSTGTPIGWRYVEERIEWDDERGPERKP